MKKIPHIRWIIAVMLFLAAILNYIDRQDLAILAPTIQKDLALSDADYGQVINLFLVAYTISLLLSGRLVDKIGARASMALFVGWWSISDMLTGLARSVTSLGAFRFMLGLGEAGNWPSATKAVSEWFAPKERAFAIGFYTMGATIGATIAPVLILALVSRFNWQAVFIANGIMGLMWIVPWLWIYRRPQEHPRVTDKELATIGVTRETPATVAAAEAAPRQSEWQRWKDALSRREVWLLMVGRMLTDPLWFFFQFWFAKYLYTARHVSQEDLKITWVVYLAADIGSLAGGLLSGYLIKRGAGAAKARMWIMLGCALITPWAPLAATTPSLTVAMAVGVAVVLAHLAWLSNISAMVVDLIPKSLVATCFGVIAAGSALGAIAMNKLVVFFVGNYSYTYWFVVMAFLHPTAWLVLRLLNVTRNDPSKLAPAAN